MPFPEARAAYYQLCTSTVESIEGIRTWCCPFREANYCDACGTDLSDLGPVDVHVQNVPLDIPFNFVDCALIPVARLDFLAAIGNTALTRGFHLGKVLDNTGRELQDWKSIRGRYRIHIRGGKRSEYRQCEKCGSHVYTPIGNYYLLSHSLTGEPVYQAHVGFVVNHDIYGRVFTRKWKNVKLYPLPVYDKPRDGRDDLVI